MIRDATDCRAARRGRDLDENKREAEAGISPHRQDVLREARPPRPQSQEKEERARGDSRRRFAVYLLDGMFACDYSAAKPYRHIGISSPFKNGGVVILSERGPKRFSVWGW
jgi:hypothetical protein